MIEKIFVRGGEVYLGKIRKDEEGYVMFWAEKRGMTTSEIFNIFLKMMKMKMNGDKKWKNK